MNVIKHGSRGSAVEDIQRRLIYVGYSLDTTGVDGVFLNDTEKTLMKFQLAMGLEATGEVDSCTWSMLVDSTFAFGDRMLYLRYPLFHGRDVEILQVALNSLGFTCGDVDGIFGTYTERAVIELQSNMGLPADGVVGRETFSTLNSLKHMWEGKKVVSHSSAQATSTHRNKVLAHLALVITAQDPMSYQVARRIKNLAQASYEDASVTTIWGESVSSIGPAKETYENHVAFTLYEEDSSQPTTAISSVVQTGSSVKLDLQLVELGEREDALMASITPLVEKDPCGSFVIKIPANTLGHGSKQGFQNIAVLILDAVCGAYGDIDRAI
ncbi:MAG: peptidoglycan-binding protein [Coriobacteriia bacterium]|nr:peptidoglycan-binding protein [Coriobacteriia bacterium]